MYVIIKHKCDISTNSTLFNKKEVSLLFEAKTDKIKDTDKMSAQSIIPKCFILSM